MSMRPKKTFKVRVKDFIYGSINVHTCYLLCSAVHKNTQTKCCSLSMHCEGLKILTSIDFWMFVFERRYSLSLLFYVDYTHCKSQMTDKTVRLRIPFFQEHDMFSKNIIVKWRSDLHARSSWPAKQPAHWCLAKVTCLPGPLLALADRLCSL